MFAGDPNRLNTSIDDYMSVDQEDILRVSQSVLNQRQVRLRVLPERSLSPATTNLDRTMMPPPAKEPVFTPPLPEQMQLPNGLKVVVVEKHDMPVVTFGLVISAGAITDPSDKPGIAGFTAQMLSEGTDTRSSLEIAAAFEFIGARLSAEPAGK